MDSKKETLCLMKNRFFGRENKVRSLVVIWIIFALVIGIISAIKVVTWTMDDTYMMENFKGYAEEKGFWRTIGFLFTNMDLVKLGELRTYGLSKVIHYLVFNIVGDNKFFYQFIITVSHILMGGVVYKVLRKLKINELASMFGALTFSFNPFAHMQTFHHYTYIMIPLYFVITYIYFELCNLEYYKVNKGRRKRCIHIRSVFLIFCTVFTGEYTLSVIGFAIVCFIIYGIITKNKYLVKTYVMHIILEISMVLSWVLIWKNVLSENSAGRYVKQVPSFSSFYMITDGLKYNLKRFLFLGEDNKLDMGSDGVTSYVILIIIIIAVSLMFLACFNYLRNKSKLDKEKVNPKIGILVLLFSISSLIVYCSMNIVYASGLASHYLYSVFTLFSMAAIIIIFSIFSRKTSAMIGLGIMILFSGYNAIWFSYQMPTAAKVDNEIIRKIEKFKDMGKKSIIIVSEHPLYGEVLLNSKCYRPLSAFSSCWASSTYFSKMFENVSYIMPNAKFIENSDGTVQILDELIVSNNASVNSVTINKDDCFIIGNENTGGGVYS